MHRQRLTQKTTLGVGLGGSPDSETESTLVNQIRDVVNDVDAALSMVREGRSEVDHVVSQWVHDPSNGDNQSEGVESGLACLGAGVTGDSSSLTAEDFEDNVEPSEHTDDESDEDRAEPRLASPSSEEHDDGADEEPPEESGGQIGRASCRERV